MKCHNLFTIHKAGAALHACAIALALIAATPIAARAEDDYWAEQKKLRMVDPAIDAEGPFCYLSKPSTCLAVPASKRGVQVTFDGAFWAGGAELCFLYGQPPRPVMVRQKEFLDGWMPIVRFGWKDAAIAYSIEAFVNTLDADPLSTSILFVKLTARNTSASETLPAHVASATRYFCEDHRFAGLKQFPFSPDWTYEMTEDALIRGGKIALFYPQGARQEAVPGVAYSAPFQGRDFSITERAEVGLAWFEPRLAPGEEREFIFKMPVAPIPLSEPALAEAIRSANYETQRLRTIALWMKSYAPAAIYSIPEPKVEQAMRANYAYILEAIWQRDGNWMQGVNKFQYRGFWLRDAAYIIRAHEVLGRHDLAARLLEVYPKFQKSDGLFMSQEGQMDGFGQALYALGQHAFIAGDRAYAERIYPMIPPAVDWLRRARAADPMHLMPATHVADNELLTGHYTGHNFWALLGLRTAIRLAELTSHLDDARALRAEYEDFHAAFMKKLGEVCGAAGAIPPGIDAEGGQDWGNLIGLYPSEVLDPADPRVGATLEKVHREKYKEGVMTYLWGLHQYLTVKATQNHVVRGEQEQAVRDLYAILLHTGSTHEMFEWQAVPWGHRDVTYNYPPHGWGSAMLTLLLRNMLVMERGGEGGLGPREIHLFSAISPEWAAPGREIRLENAPTECGPLDASLRFSEGGAVLEIESHFRETPSAIVVHIPYFVKLESAKSETIPYGRLGDALMYPPDVRRVELKWTRREGVEPLSFERAVAEYRHEYARRYADYKAAGGETVAIEAPAILSPAERARQFRELYDFQNAGLAVGCRVTASSPSEPGHPPEFAVDGDSRDKDASSWWVGPPAPQWIQLDLGSARNISAVRVYPYWDGERAYQYFVETSADGREWQRVGDRSANKLAATAAGDLFEFAPNLVRYVRVTMLHNTANTSFHLVEVRVF